MIRKATTIRHYEEADAIRMATNISKSGYRAVISEIVERGHTWYAVTYWMEG